MRAEGETADAVRKAGILEAALDLFLRYGMRRTSVEDIARAAGIGKGSVYLSFASKEALFAAMAVHLCEGYLAEGSAALARGDLEAAVTGYLEAVVVRPGRMLFGSPHAGELIASKRVQAGPIFEAYHRRVEAMLAERLAGAGIPAPDVARLLLAAARGCAVEEPEADRAVEIGRMVAVVLAGLRGVG